MQRRRSMSKQGNPRTVEDQVPTMKRFLPPNVSSTCTHLGYDILRVLLEEG